MSDLRALSAMHYWPTSSENLPSIACGAERGFRTSARDKVTCQACRAAVGPVADRRQRAREALRDAASSIEHLPAEVDPVEVAIEVATRVKVTHDIVRAFIEAPDDAEDIAGPLEAAFRAAGFEVEK